MRLAAIDIEPTAEASDALGKAAQAEVPGGRLGPRHADAVIGDSHDDALSIGVDHNVDVRGMRVPQRIDQPFLHDSVY